MLTPFTIEHYLQKMQEQKTIALRLSKLPHLPGQIERIVELALKGKLQRPSLGVDPSLFEQMRAITVFASTDLDLDVPVRLAPGETDFALEIRTSGGASIPVGGTLEIWPSDYVEHKTELSIGAGSTTYEEVTVRRIDPGTVEVRLDDYTSLTVRDSPARRSCTVNLTAQSNFAARKRALEFVIALVDSHQIQLDGQPMQFDEMADDNAAKLPGMRQHLESLRDLQRLLDLLAVDGGYVEMDELDDRHWENLRQLHRVLVQGLAPANPSGKSTRVLVELGRWAAMLLLIADDDAPNTWRCVDPFDRESPQVFRWSADDDPGSSVPVTPYDTLEPEHLQRILNLRLASITDAYEAIVEFENTAGLAN